MKVDEGSIMKVLFFIIECTGTTCDEMCLYSFVVSDETCRMFLLRTSGFKSNKILLTAMKKSKDGLLPSPDQRGKTVPTNKFSE